VGARFTGLRYDPFALLPFRGGALLTTVQVGRALTRWTAAAALLRQTINDYHAWTFAPLLG